MKYKLARSKDESCKDIISELIKCNQSMHAFTFKNGDRLFVSEEDQAQGTFPFRINISGEPKCFFGRAIIIGGIPEINKEKNALTKISKVSNCLEFY